jgi:hypothetical protein
MPYWFRLLKGTLKLGSREAGDAFLNQASAT